MLKLLGNKLDDYLKKGKTVFIIPVPNLMKSVICFHQTIFPNMVTVAPGMDYSRIGFQNKMSRSKGD